MTTRTRAQQRTGTVYTIQCLDCRREFTTKDHRQAVCRDCGKKRIVGAELDRMRKMSRREFVSVYGEGRNQCDPSN